MKEIFSRAVWRSLAWTDHVPFWIMLQLSISSLLNLGTAYAAGGMGLALVMGIVHKWVRPKAYAFALVALVLAIFWCGLAAIGVLTYEPLWLVAVGAAIDAILLGWAMIVGMRMGGIRELARTLHRQRRIPCDIEGILQIGEDRGSFRVVDLSGGGLLARVSPRVAKGMQVGDQVTVWFEFAEMPLALEAKIIHKDRKGPALCGLQFIGRGIETPPEGEPTPPEGPHASH